MIFRRILFLFIACVSLLLVVLLPPGRISDVFVHSGYYFILITTLLWTGLFVRVHIDHFMPALKANGAAVGLSAILSIMIFTASPPRYKVLADESNLTNVSLSLFQSRQAHLQYQGLEPEDKTCKVDKRPLLYPFLISIVHALRGYHVENSFVVNFLACIGLLFSCFLFLSYFLPRFFAYISLVMLAGCPIFMFWTTSGGFETVNLLFVMLVFLYFYRFCRTGSTQNAELLVLTLILLVQTRYESVLFLILIVPVILQLVRNRQRGRFGFVSYLVPLLLLPVFWQRMIFTETPMLVKNDFGLQEISNLMHAFSVDNFAANWNSNLFVLTGIEPALGFSPVIAVLAVIGAYLLTKKTLLQFQSLPSPSRHLLLAFPATLILLVIVIFSYYWGNFTSPASNRLALVFLPYVVFPAVYAVYGMTRTLPARPTRIWISVFFLFHLICFGSTGIRQENIRQGGLTRVYQKTIEYLQSNYHCDNREILIITDNPNLYMTHQYYAVNFTYANRNAERILDQYYRRFRHVVVFQKHNHLFTRPSVSNRLAADYRLQERDILKINLSRYIKVSELENSSSIPALRIKSGVPPAADGSLQQMTHLP